MAESFFTTLECELIERRSFKSKARARTALFVWIKGWYNARRLHSSLGYLSPNTYEENHGASNHCVLSTGLPAVGVRVACATPPVDNPAPVEA